MCESCPGCYKASVVPGLVDMNDIEITALHCNADGLLQVVGVGGPESPERAPREQVHIGCRRQFGAAVSCSVHG